MVSLTPEFLANVLDFPIQPPPPGVTPNFDDPDSDAYQVYITAGLCIALMLVFSVHRLVSRLCLRHEVHIAHELVFYSGLVFCLAFIAMTVACVSGGAFGRDAWNVVLGAFTKSQLVLALLIEIELPVAICLVKCSVLMLYFHIFRVLRWMRILSIIGIAVVVAWHLAISIAFAAMCAPSTGDGQLDFLAAFVSDSCASTRILVVLQGIGNVVADVFLVILPLPAVWTLRMPLTRKLAISAMFSVGLTGVASSIIGLAYRYQFWAAGDNNIRLVVPLWVTSMTEEAAGVMICCMPAIAVVFKSVKQPLKSWLSSASGRALRLTGSTWPAARLSESKESNLGGSGSLQKEAASRPDGVYCHPGSTDRHVAWVHVEADSWSLQRQNPGNTGIGKKTEIEVTRMI